MQLTLVLLQPSDPFKIPLYTGMAEPIKRKRANSPETVSTHRTFDDNWSVVMETILPKFTWAL